jgi:hypothetical protein
MGQKKGMFTSKNHMKIITKEAIYIINNRNNAIGEFCIEL